MSAGTDRAAAAEFALLDCPLDGMRLIEASAGTGKTWNICGLYLRLLLERGLEVQCILVVTFTNAATAELRDRIRQRIAGTLAQLRAPAATDGDPFAAELLAALRGRRGLADDEMVQRLELALATFDEAAIFTIHGFCQRALSDAPFAAGLPLATELVHDDSEWIAEAANDFWRRHVAGEALDPALAALLVRQRDTPEKFARLLKRHLAKPTAVARWPAGIEDAGAIDGATLVRCHAEARALWAAHRTEIVETLTAALAQLKGNSYKDSSVAAAAMGWDELLHDSDAVAALELQPEKIDLLASGRLQDGTKKGCTTPAHPFFAAAQSLLDARELASDALRRARLRLLRELLEQGSTALREAKRRRRVVAFDDMLFNLHERLAGDGAATLAAALRARYPAALVDEFQDTDPLQFAIFETIYGGGGGHTLFLVGDPKQAIYSFRNADLHTYLQARSRADAEYSLAANQRSTPALLDALNGLFGANPRAFMLPGLAWPPAAPGGKPRPVLVDASGPQAALQVWSLPDDPASGQPLHKKDAQCAAVDASAGEIARLLSAALRGAITIDGRALRAGDIAVLVRSHAEGSQARQALSRLGVGSVELSQASVFRSSDAEDLDRVLAAMLEPTHEGLLKAALATESLGHDAAKIEQLSGDETRLIDAVQRFDAWRELWLRQGVGVMLRRWLREERVAVRLLARADGERRLTNLLHLIECLHQASAEHPGPDALLRWLQSQRRDERADEATQLRLESDQNLVQIVTVHKSKGLEYPLVFCPLLWVGRKGGGAEALDGVEYHDDAGHAVVDFRRGFAGEFDEADVKARVRLETAAESLRLIYVALTRAVHRCVIVAGCYSTTTRNGASTTESTRSLLNWLVAGAAATPQQWLTGGAAVATVRAGWDDLAARVGPAMVVSPLPLGPAVALAAPRLRPEQFAALAPPPALPPGWWIGSYSALAHGATNEIAAADHDLRVTTVDDVSGMPPADREATPSAPLAEDDILRFPRGAAAGECLHAVFERIDFTDPDGWPGAAAAALRKLRPAAPTGGSATATEALHARMLNGMLADVLATPLPVGTARPLQLQSLPLGRRLTEMEFHLPAHRLDAAALNGLLARHGYAVPRLGFATLRGFLKGFIDLVFEHDGRYFVLDWKSNHLGDRAADYAHAPLAAAMAAQGYHLQSLIYSLALHRHLRCRLRDYRIERHFGGVLYLFVRGLRPHWRDDDGQPTGLHFHRPPPAVIEDLSALFEPDGVAA